MQQEAPVQNVIWMFPLVNLRGTLKLSFPTPPSLAFLPPTHSHPLHTSAVTIVPFSLFFGGGGRWPASSITVPFLPTCLSQQANSGLSTLVQRLKILFRLLRGQRRPGRGTEPQPCTAAVPPNVQCRHARVTATNNCMRRDVSERKWLVWRSSVPGPLLFQGHLEVHSLGPVGHTASLVLPPSHYLHREGEMVSSPCHLFPANIPAFLLWRGFP